MPTYSIQTTKETLDTLIEMLKPRPPNKSSWDRVNEDQAVSVTISAGLEYEARYYGIDGLMSSLAIGEISYTKSISKHLVSLVRNASKKSVSLEYEQKIKGHTKIAQVAASAYTCILNKNWTNIESKDSRSLNGIVDDFNYVEEKTSIGPEQELLNEVFSTLLNKDSPERYIPFLSGVWIRYLKKRGDIGIFTSHIHKIYPLIVNVGIQRTLERVNKLYDVTGIKPVIDGNKVSPDIYAAKMVEGLKNRLSGG